MNIIFMGTSDFAVAALDALCENDMKPCLVVSQPDKPRNRGVVTSTPVKARATELGIEVITPDKIKNGELSETLEKYKPDVIVVVAYGKILPPYVLEYPKYGCINIHASLLPKYRGAAPINFALINGESESGVTTMHMDKGLDTGDMIFAEKTPITSSDNVETLHDRLAEIGGRLIVKTLRALEEGTAPRIQQEGESTYAPMIDNELRKIDFSAPAKSIESLVKGLSPVPTAYALFGGKNVKIYDAVKIEGNESLPVGTICGGKKLVVQTGDGLLEIKALQPESKKRMSGEDFLRGRQGGRFE